MANKTNKRVMLIGAGRRAQSVILPALWQLRDAFELRHVVAKSARQVEAMDGRWPLDVKDNFNNIDFKSLDIIILAVAQTAVSQVIRKLVKQEVGHIQLMVDTPVLPLASLGALKNFKKFKQVVVSEDSFLNPLYIELQSAVKRGSTGRLRQIIFDQSGYRYHALAAIRLLTGAKYIKKVRIKKLPDGKSVRIISLPGGSKAEIIEPRDYKIGKIIISGDKGDAKYDLRDYPEMTQLQIQGFKGLLEKLDNLPVPYSPLDGIYDNILLKITDKTGYFCDWPWGRKSAFYCLLKAASILAKA